MGIFDKFRRKDKREESEILLDTRKSEVIDETSVPKASLQQNALVSRTKELFFSLGLDKTLLKVGLQNLDLELLMTPENVKELAEGEITIVDQLRGLTIVIRGGDDKYLAVTDISTNKKDGHRVSQEFDRKTLVETSRTITDYEELAAKNQIVIVRDPKRIEKVSYMHKRKSKRNDMTEDDLLYGGDSFTTDTLQDKAIDLSRTSGDISSLDALDGITDEELIALTEQRDSKVHEKYLRIYKKIVASSKANLCCEYLVRDLKDVEKNAFFLKSSYDFLEYYKNIIEKNFTADQRAADSKNHPGIMFDSFGNRITMTPEEKARREAEIRSRYGIENYSNENDFEFTISEYD